MEPDNPTPSGVGAVAPRYTSMRRNEGESESELSGELWVVSGNFGVKKKKAWVVVNYATRRLSIYSSYSRDHSKLLDDVDFKLIVKLFWFTHDSPAPNDIRSSQKPHRYWYFGLELVKEPGGTDHHYPQEPGKQQGTMRDRKSEVVIFCTDIKEHYSKWEGFLGGEESTKGGVVVSNREDARIYENNDRIVDLTNNFESELAALRAAHHRELQDQASQLKSKVDAIEAQYSHQLNDVVARSDHERMIATFTVQKKEFQSREVQFQEGLKFAQGTIQKLTAENTDFSGKYKAEIARLEEVIRDQEAERRETQSRLQREKETVAILTREVTDRVREEKSGSTDHNDNPDLEKKIKSLELQISQLKADNSALMSQIADSARSNISDGPENLLTKIQELEDDNCKLVMSLQETQEELSTKDEQLSFTGEAMDKAADEIEQQRELVFQIHELLQAEFPNDIRSNDQLGTMSLLVDLIESLHSKQPSQSHKLGDESEAVRQLEEELEAANNSLAATSCELSKTTKQLITRTNELMAAEKKVEQLGGHTSPRPISDVGTPGGSESLQSRFDALSLACDEKDRKIKHYGDRIQDLEKKLALLVIGEGDDVGVEEKSSSIESVVTSIQSQAEVYKAKFEEQQVKSKEHEEKLELLLNELNRAKAENSLVLSALKNDHDMDMSRLSCISDSALEQLKELGDKQHSVARDKLHLEEDTGRNNIEAVYNSLLVAILTANLNSVSDSMTSLGSLVTTIHGAPTSISSHISTTDLFSEETLCRFDLYSCFQDGFITLAVDFNARVSSEYQSAWGQIGSIMANFGPSSPSRDPATHVSNKTSEYAQALSDIRAVLDWEQEQGEAEPFEISKAAILEITKRREDANLLLRKVIDVIKKFTQQPDDSDVPTNAQQSVSDLGRCLTDVRSELITLSGMSTEEAVNMSITDILSAIRQNSNRMQSSLTTEITALASLVSSATAAMSPYCEDPTLNIADTASVVCDLVGKLQLQISSAVEQLAEASHQNTEGMTLPDIVELICGESQQSNATQKDILSQLGTLIGSTSEAEPIPSEMLKQLAIYCDEKSKLLEEITASKQVLEPHTTSDGTLLELCREIVNTVDICKSIITEATGSTSGSLQELVSTISDSYKQSLETLHPHQETGSTDLVQASSRASNLITKSIDILNPHCSDHSQGDLIKLVSEICEHMAKVKEILGDEVIDTNQITKLSKLVAAMATIQEATSTSSEEAAAEEVKNIILAMSKAALVLSTTPAKLSEAAAIAGSALQELEALFSKGEPTLNLAELSNILQSCSNTLGCAVTEIPSAVQSSQQTLKDITKLLGGVPGDDPMKLCSNLVQKHNDAMSSSRASSATFIEEISSSKQQCSELQDVISSAHELLQSEVPAEARNSDLVVVSEEVCKVIANLRNVVAATIKELQQASDSTATNLLDLTAEVCTLLQSSEEENTLALKTLADNGVRGDTLADATLTVAQDRKVALDLLSNAGFTSPTLLESVSQAVKKIVDIDNERRSIEEVLNGVGVDKEEGANVIKMADNVVQQLRKLKSEVTSATTTLSAITGDKEAGLTKSAAMVAEAVRESNQQHQQLQSEVATASSSLSQGLQLPSNSSSDATLTQLASDCANRIATLTETERSASMKLAGDLKGLDTDTEHDDKTLSSLTEDVSKLLHRLHRQHEFAKDKLRLLGGDVDDSDFSKFAEDTAAQMHKLKCDAETCILRMSAVLSPPDDVDKGISSLTDMMVSQFNNVTSENAAACASMSAALKTIGVNIDRDSTLSLISDVVQKQLFSLNNDIKNGSSLLEAALSSVSSTAGQGSLVDLCESVQHALQSQHSSCNVASDCLQGIIAKTGGSVENCPEMNTLCDNASKAVLGLLTESSAATAVLQPSLAALEGSVTELSLLESCESAQKHLQRLNLESAAADASLRSALAVGGVQAADNCTLGQLSDMVQKSTHKYHNGLSTISNTLKLIASQLNLIEGDKDDVSDIELAEQIHIAVQRLHSENQTATSMLKDSPHSSHPSNDDSSLLTLVENLLKITQSMSSDSASATATLQTVVSDDDIAAGTPLPELAEIVCKQVQKLQKEQQSVSTTIRSSLEETDHETDITELVSMVVAKFNGLQDQQSNSQTDIQELKALLNTTKERLFQLTSMESEKDLMEVVDAVEEEITTSRDLIDHFKSSFPDCDNLPDAIASLQHDFTSVNTYLTGSDELPTNLEKVTADIIALLPSQSTNKALLPLCESMLSDYHKSKELIGSTFVDATLSEQLQQIKKVVGAGTDGSQTLTTSVSVLGKLLGGSSNDLIENMSKCKSSLESLVRSEEESTIVQLIEKLVLSTQRQSESNNTVTALHEECQQEMLKVTAGDADSAILTLTKQVVSEAQKCRAALHSDPNVDALTSTANVKDQLLSLLPPETNCNNTNTLTDIATAVQDYMTSMNQLLGGTLSPQQLNNCCESLSDLLPSDTPKHTLIELVSLVSNNVNTMGALIGTTLPYEIISHKNTLFDVLPEEDGEKCLLNLVSEASDQIADFNQIVGADGLSALTECKEQLTKAINDDGSSDRNLVEMISILSNEVINTRDTLLVSKGESMLQAAVSLMDSQRMALHVLTGSETPSETLCEAAIAIKAFLVEAASAHDENSVKELAEDLFREIKASKETLQNALNDTEVDVGVFSPQQVSNETKISDLSRKTVSVLSAEVKVVRSEVSHLHQQLDELQQVHEAKEGLITSQLEGENDNLADQLTEQLRGNQDLQKQLLSSMEEQNLLSEQLSSSQVKVTQLETELQSNDDRFAVVQEAFNTSQQTLLDKVRDLENQLSKVKQQRDLTLSESQENLSELSKTQVDLMSKKQLYESMRSELDNTTNELFNTKEELKELKIKSSNTKNELLNEIETLSQDQESALQRLIDRLPPLGTTDNQPTFALERLAAAIDKNLTLLQEKEQLEGSIRSQLADTLEERDNLKKQVEHKLQSEQKLKHEKDELEESMRSELNAAKEERDNLRHQVEAASVELLSLKGESEKLRVEQDRSHTSMQRSRELLKNTSEGLEAKLQEAQNTAIQKEETTAQLQKQLVAALESVTSLKKETSTLQDDLESSRRHNKNLTDELTELKGSSVKQYDQLKASLLKVTSLEDSFTKLEYQHQSTTRSNSALEGENEQLTIKLSALQKKLTTLDGEASRIPELEGTLDTQSDQIKMLQREINTYKEDLDFADSKIQRVRELQDLTTQMETDLASSKRMAKLATQKAQDFEAENTNLQKELTAIKGSLLESRSKLQELEGRLSAEDFTTKLKSAERRATIAEEELQYRDANISRLKARIQEHESEDLAKASHISKLTIDCNTLETRLLQLQDEQNLSRAVVPSLPVGDPELEMRCERLQEEVTRNEREIESLRNERRSIKEQISNLQDTEMEVTLLKQKHIANQEQISSLENSLQKTEQKLRSKHEEITTLAESVEHEKRQRVQAERAVQDLEEEVQNMTTKLTVKASECADTSEQLHQQQKQTQHALRENDVLSDKLSHVEEDNKNKQQQINDQNQTIDDTKADLAKLQRTTQELTEDKAHSARKIQQLELDAANAEAAEKKSKETVSQMEEKANELTNEISNLSEDLNKLTKKSKEQQQEFDDISSDYSSLKANFEKNSQKLQASEECVKELKQQNTDLTEECSSLGKKFQKHQQQHESLSLDQETSQNKIKDLQSQVQQAQTDLQASKQEIAHLTEERDVANRKLQLAKDAYQQQQEDSDRAMQKASQRASELTSEIALATDQNKELTIKVDQLQEVATTVDGLKQKISSQAVELQESIDAKQSLQRELSSAKQSSLELSQQLESNRRSLSEIQTSLAAAGNGEEALKKEVSRLSNLIESQEDEFTHKSNLQKRETARLTLELEEAVSDQGATQQKLQQLRHTHEEEVDELRKEVSDLTIKVNSLSVSNTTLVKQLEASTSEGDSLRAKIQKQKQTLSQEQDATEELRKTNHSLKQEVEAAKKELTTFQTNTVAESETRNNMALKYETTHSELTQVQKELAISQGKVAESEAQIEILSSKLTKKTLDYEDLVVANEKDAAEARRLRPLEDELHNISSKIEILLPITSRGISPMSSNLGDDDFGTSPVPRSSGSVIFRIYKFINILQEVLAEAESLQGSSKKLEVQTLELKSKVEMYRTQERRALQVLSENLVGSPTNGNVVQSIESSLTTAISKRKEAESELVIVSGHSIEMENKLNEVTVLRNEELERHSLITSYDEGLQIIQRSMANIKSSRIVYLEKTLSAIAAELQKQAALMDKEAAALTPSSAQQKLTPSTQKSTPWLLKGWGDISTRTRSPRTSSDPSGDEIYEHILTDVTALCSAYNKAVDQVPADQYQELISRYEVEIACKDQEIQRITRESISRTSRASSVDPTLGVQLRASESRVQELEYDISDLRLQIDKLSGAHRDEINQQSIKIDQLTTELAITRRTEAETQNTLTSVTRQLDIAEEALAKSSSAYSKAASLEVQQLRMEVERYEGTIRDYDNVALQLRVRHDEMKQRISTLESQVALKNSQIQQLNEDLSQAMRRLDEESAIITSRAAELQQIVRQKVAHDDETERQNMLVEAHNKRMIQPTMAVHQPNALPRGPTPPPRLTFQSLSKDYSLHHVSHP